MNVIYVVANFLQFLLYAWVLYNTPILAMGIRRMVSATHKAEEKGAIQRNLPTVSIVVPVKDEEKVIGRLLKALLRLDYAPEKMEIIIVEDSSQDKTADICKRFRNQHPTSVKFFHRSTSNGKPSALNFGFKHAKGDIVAIFDADNIPETNVLMRAVKYFEDPAVAAVQGTTMTINAEENMLTKFISYEQAAWLKNYLQGKDALNLFVPLTGSCQFIRRDVLEKVGDWDESCLAEDLDMSAKITHCGFHIRYAPDIISWQEAPSSLTQLINQRIRWFRGYMEVANKYGRLLKRLEKRSLDTEITLIGPYVLTLFFVRYIISIYTSFFPVEYDFIFTTTSRLTLLLTTMTLLMAGVGLVYATKPRKTKNLLWLPFIYAYWSLQGLITSYSLLQVVFKRPKRWVKTDKTGRCTEILHR